MNLFELLVRASQRTPKQVFEEARKEAWIEEIRRAGAELGRQEARQALAEMHEESQPQRQLAESPKEYRVPHIGADFDKDFLN